MNFSMDLLQARMPPPLIKPTFTHSWAAMKAKTGLTFPPEFREFIDIYGEGLIGDELGVPDPRRPYSQTRWVEVCTACYPDDLLPHPMFPASEICLYPLADNGSGDVLYGTESDGIVSDKILWAGNVKEQLWVELPGPFVSCILGLIDGTNPILLEQMSEELWHLEPVFTPTARP